MPSSFLFQFSFSYIRIYFTLDTGYNIWRFLCSGSLFDCFDSENYTPDHGSFTSKDTSAGTATYTCDPGYEFSSGSVTKVVDCLDCKDVGKPWETRVGDCIGKKVIWCVFRMHSGTCDQSLSSSSSTIFLSVCHFSLYLSHILSLLFSLCSGHSFLCCSLIFLLHLHLFTHTRLIFECRWPSWWKRQT